MDPFSLLCSCLRCNGAYFGQNPLQGVECMDPDSLVKSYSTIIGLADPYSVESSVNIGLGSMIVEDIEMSKRL